MTDKLINNIIKNHQNSLIKNVMNIELYIKSNSIRIGGIEINHPADNYRMNKDNIARNAGEALKNQKEVIKKIVDENRRSLNNLSSLPKEVYEKYYMDK